MSKEIMGQPNEVLLGLVKTIRKAERERCAQLCRRPAEWFNVEQKKVADEIMRAIRNLED